MKRIFFLLVVFLVLTSCVGGEQLEGEFLMVNEVAILKGDDFIYGVEVNGKSKQLAQKAQEFQKEEYDMVTVIIKGTLHPKAAGAEGWDTIVKVTKIINVMPPQKDQGIILQAKNNK